MQDEEERRRKTVLAVEAVTLAAANSADAVLAAIAEQEDRMNRERPAIAQLMPMAAVEEMGIQGRTVRAVAPAVVSRENSEEILEHEEKKPSPSGPSSPRRRLIEQDNSRETKKKRTTPKV